MSRHMTGYAFTIRKKVFKLFGNAFHVYGPGGDLLLYSKQKAFKLKEDIRLYTGEDMTKEVLRIKARQVIDFSAAYDVVDAATNEKIGALKRKGFKSIIKDEWVIMDAQDRDVGLIQEDSLILALVRRFITDLLPQTFTVTVQGSPACTYRQNFNPFVKKIGANYAPGADGLLDRRLYIAGAILLCAIEGRQG